MPTSESSLSSIFSLAGPLVSTLPYDNHILHISGESPVKKFKNEWFHKNGTVTCDEKYNWKFEPHRKVIGS